MPRQVSKTVYKFDELSDKAKEKAREWWRTDMPFVHEYLLDEAANIAEAFGLDIRQNLVTRKDKTFYYDPSIQYSGFYHQGSGCSFRGHYKYKKGALKAIKKEYPTETKLHEIVRDLQEVQRKAFYKLRVKITDTGRYFSMSVEVKPWEFSHLEQDLKEIFESFATWIYKSLQDEYEYQNADEQVDETLISNEYDFLESGAQYV